MELLAHISAPSTRKHDARYRQQATNYGLFEVHEKTVVLTSVADDLCKSHGLPPSLAPATSLHDSPSPSGRIEAFIGPSRGRDVADSEIAGVYLGDTLQAVAALESQIITSSLREALEDGSESQFSLEISTGSLSQQLPGVLISPEVANVSSESRVRHTQSDLEVVLPGQEYDAVAPQASNVPSSSWSNENIPTELPSTYEVSEETSGSGPVRTSGDSNQTSTRKRTTGEDATPVLLSPLHPRSKRARSEATPTTSPQRIASTSPPRSPQPNDHNLQPNDPIPSSSPHLHSSPPPQSTTPLSDLPLLLQPPPPPTSLLPSPTTFLTPTLSSLSSTPSLSDRFRPRLTSRPIANDERGHWSFSLSPFTPQQANETWAFLARVVQSGSAGWGVWCAREDEGGARVYCFGETVGEVYLLLYVASRSRVRKAGAVWRDAKGEVVVSMR